jgi:transmembrane sensor
MSTPNSLPRYDAPEHVMRLAGAWLARKDRGFTSAECEEFENWIRANRIHAAAVAQLERTMSTFNRLRELAPREGAPPNCDALAPARSSRRWLPVAGVGIAAAIAIVFWSGRFTFASDTWRYSTPVGGYDHATLVDGSTVHLNSDTVVEVDYTPTERQVRLRRGEAHFHVAKDASRPFVVQAKTISVSAVGTAFNVRLATTDIEVLVTHGTVRVAQPVISGPSRTAQAATPAELPLLTAGQKVIVSTVVQSEPTAIAAVSVEEIQRALAWQRVAEFNRTPLCEIVEEFNRQNQQQIVIRDRELDSLRIGGSFRTDQPEAFVRLLETSFGIAADRSGRLITLRKAAAESP